MKTHTLTIILVVVGSLLFSCKKTTPPGTATEPLVFHSLTSEDTIKLHQTCDVIADASGTELTYSWTQDLGTLIGSGSTVNFNGCCTGDHIITCTVTDVEGNQEMKEINIFVKP